MTSKQKWILVVAALAAFMTALDTLVVTTALSTIRRDLAASVEQLEWTVNAYNLSLAALRRIPERHGPDKELDLPGLALVSGGVLGLVWGLVRGNSAGWASAEVLGAFVAAIVLLSGFAIVELRSRAPMLPMRFFRSRAF